MTPDELTTVTTSAVLVDAGLLCDAARAEFGSSFVLTGGGA